MAGTLRASRTTVRPKLVTPLVAALFVSPAFAGDPVTPPGEATIYREAALADCERVGTRPMLPGLVDLAVLGAIDEISNVVTGPDVVAAAQPTLDQLAEQFGDLDALPSLELQFLLAVLAEAAGDTARHADRRAYATALLEMMIEGRDGASPARAFRTCLASNEYVLARHVLGVREVRRQSVVQHDGRSYDRLDVRMNNGRKRSFYFDVTDILRTGPGQNP
ncbi:hypothetical protein [Luteimonas sp. YGD11-2]|uniref:hypothetical protein n=1 Tax=Luteimonas sp. YGD11-2 TaxID=2508168 RepID=UPI00100B0F8D|nr:hypothetical protein [Luteimonas sp. YGD11-2]